MRISIALGLAATAASLASAGARAATAEVRFVNPDQFSDAGTSLQWIKPDDVLGNLKEHVVNQAAKLLPADQTLYVDVTDVDLAGQYDPRQLASREVRVVKENHPPRIDLAFRLVAADGRVVSQGRRTLRDPGFLTRPALGYDGDYLRYEKVMLDRWMKSELAAGQR
jgi:hypothetical protein